MRQAIASLAFEGPQRFRERLPEVEVRLADGGRMHVRVVGHSVEVKAVIGATTFETQFGELTVKVGGHLPQALAASCVGRLLDEVALHPLTAGRGWRITTAKVFAFGTTFTIETGSVPWRWSGEW